LIVAAGSPHLVTKDYVREGQVVVDVGINSVPRNSVSKSVEKLEYEIPKRQLVGDVDFEAVKNIVEAISPVPGGVGPMTVLSLFENLLEASS
jgi:methylenetetrahydrofolate dehydrogenase (NADP+)/methenyltetrahydrofolate cyclohydrolase